MMSGNSIFQLSIRSLLLLLIPLFMGQSLKGQEGAGLKGKKELSIEKDFSVLKKYDSRYIVPFTVGNSFGYIDAKTGKVIVEPRYRSLGFFTPGTSGTLNDSISFSYDATTGKLTFTYPLDEDDEVKIDVVDQEGVSIVDVAPEEYFDGHRTESGNMQAVISRGFTMDSNNKITSFPAIYNRSSPAFFNLMGPYRIKGKWYAVAHKKESSGVIDQDGNPLPGFDFVHKDLIAMPESDDSLQWFYYTGTDGRSGFIDENGNKRLEGELFDYPLYSSNKFGYAVQHDSKSKLSGVLDVVTKKWLVKPQKYQITDIFYSSTEEFDYPYPYTSRDKVTIWIQVYENGNLYVINKDGKLIKPSDRYLEKLAREQARSVAASRKMAAKKDGSTPVRKDEVIIIPGYTDINELFRDFPRVLKSGSWKEIENYCRRILPDAGTLAYMREKGFAYRGLPEIQDKLPLALDYIRISYLENIVRFLVRIEQDNKLNDLVFAGVEEEGTEVYNKELGIEATETFIILQSGETKYHCKLGEMFRINGVWKSFTEPKLGWQ
ncbi:MAG: hypothetical protein U0X39_11510 [Bacteroidales bacterium]